MYVLDSIRECGYCKRKVTGEFCNYCMSHFRHTPELENMMKHEKQAHIIAMKKAELPQWLVRRRLSEILDCGTIDPMRYMDHKWFRHMYESMTDY